MPAGPVDHLFVLAFAVVIPVFSALYWYPHLQRAVDAGGRDARRRAYRRTMLWQWSLVAIAILIWLSRDRGLAELGLAVPTGWRFWVCVPLTAALIIGLDGQRRRVLRDRAVQRQLRRQVTTIAALLPHTRRELSLFIALSVTAGVCEELLYRGVLIWYLMRGLEPDAGGFALAIVGSAAVFALAHMYQGALNTLRVFAVGLIVGTLYVVSGSLWLPMLLHAFIDVNSGRMAYEVLRERS